MVPDAQLLADMDALAVALQNQLPTDFPIARIDLPQCAPFPVGLDRLAALYSDEEVASLRATSDLGGRPFSASISLCGRVAGFVEFLFDGPTPTDLTFPPDVVVSGVDSSFQCSLADIAPYLVQWNGATDASGQLVAIIKRIRDLIKAHHLDLVLRFPDEKIRFEMSTCAEIDMEVGIFHDHDEHLHADVTTIVMDLPVTYHTDALDDAGTGVLTAHVLVEHRYVTDPVTLEFSLMHTEATHWLPSAWIARQDAFKFPSYAPDVPLLEYVSMVRGALTDGVDALFNTFHRRKTFTQRLATLFADCIVEIDTTQYAETTLLLESTKQTRSVLILATVRLPEQFPREPPALILRAPLHTQGDSADDVSTAGGGGGSTTASLRSSTSSRASAAVAAAVRVPEVEIKWKSWAFSSRWTQDELLSKTRVWVLGEVDNLGNRLLSA
ncbi:hypothetical protein AMAG_03488 [Allomyces macrogynus ATCC 38327]|uniref:BRISC and BRCA1-A complex member 2 n=1 Tax=Allomyces macrogynus (strain ATCC 38327) TaxID=578462 RepID=A0A0L0S9N5_ALLM3|nr:hypothetical protein AMAG_03488 [Allomyces macrogynus ATCC 38327]|eukprot:KNE59162.1 hypothetical protein AMAG_03488 [Allomyces macrogynus ATCC 38327]